jgi:hypothetical protein
VAFEFQPFELFLPFNLPFVGFVNWDDSYHYLSLRYFGGRADIESKSR